MALLPCCLDADLPPLPAPVVDGFAESVREQITAATQRARQSPTDAPAVGDLGRILYSYGQLDAARDCFLRSRALAPDRFEWVYLLGVVETDLGRLDEARAALQAAASIRPNDLPARIRLADLLEGSGELDSARELLQEGLGDRAGSAAAHYRLGRLTAASDLASAIGHFEAAVAIEPDYREALYALAGAYRSSGRETEAEEHIARYEQSDPNPRRHYADPIIDSLASIRERTAQEMFSQGHALQARGDLEGALVAFGEVLEVDPGHAQAHVNLIAVHGQLGDHEKASFHYGRAVSLKPDIAEAHYNFGVSSHFAGDVEGAAEAFRKALAINPHSADAHGNLGASLDSLGRAEEAARHFRLAIEQDPGHPIANFHLGRQLAERGDYQRALPHLETAVATVTPGTGLHAFLLALVHRQLGSAERAAHYGRIALGHAREGGHEDLEQRIRTELGL